MLIDCVKFKYRMWDQRSLTLNFEARSGEPHIFGSKQALDQRKLKCGTLRQPLTPFGTSGN